MFKLRRRKQSVTVSAVEVTGSEFDRRTLYELSPNSYGDNPLPLKPGTELVRHQRARQGRVAPIERKHQMNPKVKVPAIVGTVVTAALAVLAGLGTIPELAPVCTAATTAITTTTGWFTYAD